MIDHDYPRGFMTVPCTERRSILDTLFCSASASDKQTIDCAKTSDEASELVRIFKVLGNEGRFLILCYLLQGERSVAEFERLLATRQSTVSQHLARLRMEGLVLARREGNMIYYSIGDARIDHLIRACTEAMR